MKIKILSLALLGLMLSGCGTPRHRIVLTYVTTKNTPVPAVDKNSQQELAEATVSVTKSLQELAAIQMATHPSVKMAAPMNPKTIGMDQQTSINWTGPVEPLLKRIASASHYKLRVLGRRPAIPLIVSVMRKEQTLAEVLRDTTYQVAKKANVTVYPSSKVIELRYYNA
jgi:defect-in-organelle-trafficking protein DotD